MGKITYMELFNDLNSKKRNKKILITTEAIEKIQYIQYDGFSDEDCQIIETLSKLVLKISKENNNSNEVAITYCLESAVLNSSLLDYIGIAKGTEHNVDPLRDTKSYHLIKSSNSCIVVLMHNHPSLSLFFLQDIRFFLENSNIRLMIVISNSGKTNYLLRCEKYTRTSAIKLYNEAVEKSNNSNNLNGMQDACKYFLYNSSKAGIKYK